MTGSPVRVLVVDDSAVIRRLLTEALQSDPMIEVAATAPNGRIALAKLDTVRPDLVTLDIEMPEMDGLATLAAIRQRSPHLPVIMFSTLTQRGAETTLAALSAGASDYVTKPANVGSVTEAIARVRGDLIPKIKALCGREAPANRITVRPASLPLGGGAVPTTPPQPQGFATGGAAAPRPLFPRSEAVEIIAIGVSTGGPPALATLLSQLPSSFPVPIVIVQHMPPVFTTQLARRLDQNSALTVREASPGSVLTPGVVEIAPGDFHVSLTRQGPITRLETHQSPPVCSCRPSVDVLFQSVASAFGPKALAVVMTGMGQDGLVGSEAIVQAGGTVIAQDQATSVVWGMPQAVTNAGLAHAVVPLDQLATVLRGAVTPPRFAPVSTEVRI